MVPRSLSLYSLTLSYSIPKPAAAFLYGYLGQINAQINALMKNLIATEIHGLGLRFSLCQGEQRPFLVYRVFPKSMTVPSALRLYHERPSSQGIPKTSQFFTSSDKILICVPVLSSIISPSLQNVASPFFFFSSPFKKGTEPTETGIQCTELFSR